MKRNSSCLDSNKITMATNQPFKEPPDKRPRLDVARKDQQDTDALWEDEEDDINFTQDELLNIDNLISMSQVPSKDSEVTPNKNNKVNNRLVGRGSPRSLSANDARSNRNPRLRPVNTVVRPQIAPSSQSRVPFRPVPSVRMSGNPTQSQGGTQQKLLEDMQRKMEEMKQESEKSKQEAKRHLDFKQSLEGQVKMLRISLAEKEQAITRQHLHHQEILEQKGVDSKQEVDGLKKEFDKAQTQLQFKDQEIHELQESCRRLEQRSVQAKQSGANNNGTFSTPRRPASVVQEPGRGEPVSPRKMGTSGFPTKESFNSPTSKKPRICTPKAQVVSDRDVLVPIKSPKNAMKLMLKNKKGQLTGAGLVSHLLPSGTDNNTWDSLFRLLGTTDKTSPLEQFVNTKTQTNMKSLRVPVRSQSTTGKKKKVPTATLR